MKRKNKVQFYSKDDDVLYAKFSLSEYDGSIELRNVDIVLDLDEKGDVIGVEIFDFQKKLEESEKRLKKILKK